MKRFKGKAILSNVGFDPGMVCSMSAKERAAGQFVAWFNSTYPQPSTHPEHPWVIVNKAFGAPEYNPCPREVISSLIDALESWAKEEDGVHPDAWQAYRNAKDYLSSGMTKDDEDRVELARLVGLPSFANLREIKIELRKIFEKSVEKSFE